MKAVIIISSLPDILFVWEDNEFAQHMNRVLHKAGFIDGTQEKNKLDYGAMAQYFAPMIASLSYMNEFGNPYSAITCKDGTLLVFKQFDNLTFVSISGNGEESEDFLRRKLAVVHRLCVMHYGTSLELLKHEFPSARKRAWQFLGRLIDTWQLLYSQQQSFLVEAVERIHVNQCLSEMAISLLDAALSTVKNKGDQNALHALLLVNTKLLALYSSRNASELQAPDILMITVLVQNIFPQSCTDTPCSSSRAPHPIASNLVFKGGTSVSEELFVDDFHAKGSTDNSLSSRKTHPVSLPIAINKTDRKEVQSRSSSSDDKFYSPPSSLTLCDDLMPQESASNSGMDSDAFFSSEINTPNGINSQDLLDTRQPEEEDFAKEKNVEEPEQKNEYFRQPVFLNTPHCPYTPHVLHLVHVASGTVLVLVNEVKYSSLAIPIYQVLTIITGLESNVSDKKLTQQQAGPIMERIETLVKKITELLKNPVGIAVEYRIRKVRDSWNVVKRSDIYGFLSSQAYELPPSLDAAVNNMIRSIKSLFSVLFLAGSDNEGPANQRHLKAIGQIQETLKAKLSDYEDYLQVKGERNVTMTAYLEDYPGLVHFIHVDRSGNQVTAPSLNTSSGHTNNVRDPCHVLKQKIWDSWSRVHVFLLQGNTFVALRDGDFLYTYCLWFEDSSGNPAPVQGLLPILSSSSTPGILSGNGIFFKDIIHRCFPAAQEGSIRCYELMCMHVGLVPVRLAARHIRKLAATLFETSLGAHYPISLIQ